RVAPRAIATLPVLWRPMTPLYSADELLRTVADAVANQDGVAMASGRGFGAGALQVRGRIFAMVSGDRLVLKLPARRVAQLIADGRGLSFDAGKRQPLREWAALAEPGQSDALALANEALEFARRG